MAGERVTTAAGGIIWRKNPDNATSGAGKLEVLVIHRPRYDDWTFPKGKSEPGESLRVTAVREIREETGLRVRLAHPLPPTVYRVTSGRKEVSYWVARTIGEDHEEFVPNREVDDLRWVRVSEARALLTYQHDVTLLDAFSSLRELGAHKTRTVVVLRHGKASDRSAWRGDDEERPLVRAGLDRSKDLVPELAAIGVDRVVSSPALRCVQTVERFAHSIARTVRTDERFSEHTRAASVGRAVGAVVDGKKPVVVCSHRPTLPWVFDALGTPPVQLAPGDGVVVHHRDGRVLATERI